jgi:hypothetical protein
MERLLRLSYEELVLPLALLAILMVVGCYIIRKIRPKPAQKEQSDSKWLLKCHEMTSKGELSNEEFRTIETTLTSRFQDELNDNGDKG